MPRFFRRSRPEIESPSSVPTTGEDAPDVTDRSKLNKRALALLEAELPPNEPVQAIAPGGGSAIVKLPDRLLVVHTGVMSKPVTHEWEASSITAIYLNGTEVALYGPDLEEADNVWLPGDSIFGTVTLANATNAIQTGNKTEAAAAVEVMRTQLPHLAEPNWDDVRGRRKARAAEEKARKEADKSEEKARKEAGRLRLPPDLHADYRAQIEPMKRVGIKDKQLLEMYQSIAAGDLIIVRKYLQLHGGSGSGMKAFQAEANVLARHGYVPTTQGFAANNALTGIAVGSGDIIVSYAKQQDITAT